MQSASFMSAPDDDETSVSQRVEHHLRQIRNKIMRLAAESETVDKQIDALTKAVLGLFHREHRETEADHLFSTLAALQRRRTEIHGELERLNAALPDRTS